MAFSTDVRPVNAEDLICAALRGEKAPWPWGADELAIDRFHERVDLHGAQTLLQRQLASCDWPAPVVQKLRRQGVIRAMWELRHQQVLAQALAALDHVGVRPVVIKGTALAYLLYEDPVLRSRGDTDLIIPVEAKERLHEVLESLGYQRSQGVSGEFVSYQASYILAHPDSSSHTLDVHWKINNSEVLSRLFTYDELRRDAQALPRLAPDAIGASHVHALLLACMHRATHRQNPYYVNGEAHHEADRLIWLNDIHLLSRHLDASGWEAFTLLAREKRLRAVCAQAMRTAQACFGTVYPGHVMAALELPGPLELPAQYLTSSKLRQQWLDFRALDSPAHYIGFARELLFPCAAYMRVKYPYSSTGALPWLYLRRAVSGVVKGLAGKGRAP